MTREEIIAWFVGLDVGQPTLNAEVLEEPATVKRKQLMFGSDRLKELFVRLRIFRTK